jgi:predicted SAM-dependent methyltransferase
LALSESTTVGSGTQQAAAPSPLREAVASLRRELWMRVTMAHAAGRLGRAVRRMGASKLKVHLGCSNDIRAGWLNVDLDTAAHRRELVGRGSLPTAFVQHDLRRGLPLPEGVCSMIYSSHLLEHLELGAGLRLLHDCHRALAPGGRFRAALPDFRRIADAYVTGNVAFFDLIDVAAAVPQNDPRTVALVDYVNYVAYQSGEHKTLYDAEKMQRVLMAVGFTDVRETDFDPALDPATEVRRRYSFYVDALK